MSAKNPRRNSLGQFAESLTGKTHPPVSPSLDEAIWASYAKAHRATTDIVSDPVEVAYRKFQADRSVRAAIAAHPDLLPASAEQFANDDNPDEHVRVFILNQQPVTVRYVRVNRETGAYTISETGADLSVRTLAEGEPGEPAAA